MTAMLSICLYATCVGSWLDPISEPSFELTANFSNPVRVGDVLQVTCTSTNHPSYSTLEIIRVTGDTEARVQAGHSPLVHTFTATAAHHTTEIYCGAWFTGEFDGASMRNMYAKSNRLPPLQVEGVTTTPSTPNIDNAKVWVKVDPDRNDYSVSDIVEWVCDAENVRAGFFEMRQVKRNLEVQLYTGYNYGWRWLSQNLTTLDDGSYVTCRVYLTDAQWNGYYLLGPTKELHIH